MLGNLLRREPVRAYLYSVFGLIVAGLLMYGVIDGEEAAFYGMAISVVLAVPATELARSKVTPVAAPNLPAHTLRKALSNREFQR